MNRDPANFECTRDPIFLLQVGVRQWVEFPGGVDTDGESIWVDDEDELDDWIRPFVRDGYVEKTPEFWSVAERCEASNGWPLVYVEWRTETVFLTRVEAEEWAKARECRWEMWKVYCVPCEGKLAKFLNELAEVVS